MLAGIRSRLTYANVMATIAVFIALGGGAYAAFNLPKNSVKSKNIVNGQIKPADVSSKTLNGAEDWHDADFDSSAAFCIWSNYGNGQNDAGYFRDRAGVVHLRGVVRVSDGGDTCTFGFSQDKHIFSLPAGYLPEHSEALATISNNAPARVNVLRQSFGTDGPGAVMIEPGFPTVADAKQWVSLDGLSFRCGPSGEDGCP